MHMPIVSPARLRRCMEELTDRLAKPVEDSDSRELYFPSTNQVATELRKLIEEQDDQLGGNARVREYRAWSRVSPHWDLNCKKHQSTSAIEFDQSTSTPRHVTSSLEYSLRFQQKLRLIAISIRCKDSLCWAHAALFLFISKICWATLSAGPSLLNQSPHQTKTRPSLIIMM